MEEIVHIIPLGYEFDRAVKPFKGEKGFRANRAYILSTVERETSKSVLEKHRYFLSKVREELQNFKIKVIVVPTDLIDLLEVIQKVSKIIRDEHSKGNIVYINISSAGRLTSVGATLSGMAHGAKVYYVESDSYADRDPRMNVHGYTITGDNPRIKHLENFNLDLPEEEHVQILVELMKKGSMKTREIIEFLKTLEIKYYAVDYQNLKRKEKSALLMKLNRNILYKLEKAGYIKKEKTGRQNEYFLTSSGKYVASISGLI